MQWNDKKSTKTLIHAYVTLRLDYCNSLLFGLPEYLIKKLQRVQNAAARLVTRTKKFDNITPVLKELHWLKIQERIEYKILLLAYKALHGQAPKYLEELVVPYKNASSYALRSNKKQDLDSGSVSKCPKYGDRTFKKAAAKLWNTIPSNLRSSESVNSFKSGLKTHLFKRLYNC